MAKKTIEEFFGINKKNKKVNGNYELTVRDLGGGGFIMSMEPRQEKKEKKPFWENRKRKFREPTHRDYYLGDPRPSACPNCTSKDIKSFHPTVDGVDYECNNCGDTYTEYGLKWDEGW